MKKIILLSLAFFLTGCQYVPEITWGISEIEKTAEEIVVLEGKQVVPKTP